jgi:SagB-type dehydrogenase family enzyme
MTATCDDYHRLTSYDRHRMGGHSLDWSNQPEVYKDYPGLKVVPLPVARPEANARLSQMVLNDPVVASPASFSLEQLSLILALAYSLTARSSQAGGEFYYRSVPSAGALYPCELYIACRDLSGLPDGLYHYALGRHALVDLRAGDFLEKPGLEGPPKQAAAAPALLFLVTTIFFRSAWKYRARSYRYHLMDSGHLVESLVLALKAASLPADVNFDFNDQEVNALLGCDPEREGCLALVSVGCEGALHSFVSGAAAELPEPIRAASRVAPKEIAYPALQEFHAAASRVSAPKGSCPDMMGAVGQFPASWKEILSSEVWPEKMNYGEAVLRRRSHRNFIREPIPQAAFQALVTLLSEEGEASGSRSCLQQQTVAAGFLAGKVEGLDPGCYWLDRLQHRVGLAKAGGLMAHMTHLCLDQEWLESASLHCFFAANLQVLETFWGPRGYRYAMLTAGRLGHRIYLGATALGLGCCGIGAFYDGEAAALLGLNEASAMLYLLAVGPVKRALR